MYEERKIRFNWLGFLLKLLIILLVLVLVLKFIPLGKKNNTNSHSKVFNKNFTKLKEVGNSYFNSTNLPKDDEEVKITLKQLINAKKIDTLKGKDKKVCNEDSSYIKAYKKQVGYELEVTLKCGEETETSHIYLGCFDDCSISSTTKKTTKKTTAKKTTKKANNSANKTTTTKKVTTTTTTTKIQKYAVIFNENGGSKVATEYVVKGNLVNKPANPVKEGFEFIGWYLDGKEYDFNTPVTGNIILMAKWKLIDNVRENTKSVKTYNETVFSVITSKKDAKTVSAKAVLNIPESIKEYQNIKIKSISYIRNFNSSTDISNYLNNRETVYSYEEGLITNAVLDNFGELDNIELNNTSDTSVSYKANIKSTCNSLLDDKCVYGIVYRVIWEYEQ